MGTKRLAVCTLIAWLAFTGLAQAAVDHGGGKVVRLAGTVQSPTRLKVRTEGSGTVSMDYSVVCDGLGVQASDAVMQLGQTLRLPILGTNPSACTVHWQGASTSKFHAKLIGR